MRVSRAATAARCSSIARAPSIDLIAHAGVDDLAYAGFCKEFMREAQGDAAHFVERASWSLLNFSVTRVHVVLELVELSRADDRDDRQVAMSQPGERDLGGRAVDCLAMSRTAATMRSMRSPAALNSLRDGSL